MSTATEHDPHRRGPSPVRVVIVMGVSGAGKTTVARALARRLGWEFIEGDDYHPARNVALMAAGHPLTDADRAPWLAALRRRIEDVIGRGEHAVVACSALRHSYRRQLAGPEGGTAVRLVQLDVPPAVLADRMRQRTGHFMPAELLESQLATLEPSQTALHLDGSLGVDAIVDRIVAALEL